MNDVKAQAEFTEFVLREMPAGTVISDPAWWAPRLWRAAVHAMTRDAAPVKDSLTTDERARFEAWYREEHGHATAWMSGLYFDAIVAPIWRGWQARAKIAADHLGDANKMVSPAADAAQAVAWYSVSPHGGHSRINDGAPSAEAVAMGERNGYRIVRLYATPQPPADDALDGGRVLLNQAIAAMSKLRQSLEFPGRNGGLYVFPEEAVKKFTDEQARIMYEEKRLAGGAEGFVTDSDRLEFVMRKFPGSSARAAGITWDANTVDAFRAAIDRAMGAKDGES